MLPAASPALNRRGEGSNPSGPIGNKASAHDVAAAYCLAMADVRVRLPLGALAIGVWESLAIPPAPEAGDRWFKSNCADSIAEGQLLVVARVC